MRIYHAGLDRYSNIDSASLPVWETVGWVEADQDAAPVEAPVEAPVQAPVEAPVETPVEVPVEEAPVEAPVEDSATDPAPSEDVNPAPTL